LPKLAGGHAPNPYHIYYYFYANTNRETSRNSRRLGEIKSKSLRGRKEGI
jgi:hypothetical protein